MEERPATHVDELAVRERWQLTDDDAPRPLRITVNEVDFVNQYLAEPLELRPNEEAYLEQYSD